MPGTVVGVAGFEPTASSSRTKRATKLRHTPKDYGSLAVLLKAFGYGPRRAG